ncbi:Glutaredoxin-1 [Wickerhamiella sorbophila]|uniref:Glutaredoxin-1 n=1 Tax=Wickerhamiella sorbophila TaxID=45607 RepID=A0A2T0FJH2_9ASCO|nr:Glutaredoxin-1 [Wickerhamiella sorbophila]PRT55136.1 Glutaredoxin-1 [Wickerhamiella sorbophila]
MLPVAKLIEKPLFLAIKRTCPYCQRALQLAQEHGVTPEVVDVLENEATMELREELTARTGQRTVPYVFSKGRFIGGYTELAQEPQSFWDSLK